VAFCRRLVLQGSREAQKYAINSQTDDFKEVLSYSHLMGTTPAASILRHFQELCRKLGDGVKKAA